MDKQREDFEAWVREYGNYPRHPELKTSDGAYHYRHTESEWRAWQAAQAAQPERAPLTDAEIEKLREKTFSTNKPFCPVDSKSMRKAVRAAEAAHGIKQGGQHD